MSDANTAPDPLAALRQPDRELRNAVNAVWDTAAAEITALRARVAELEAENRQICEHQQRLQSFITPRHRYNLTTDGDAITLRCTDHDDEIARWIGEPYRFQPVDDAAHAHEVWHHDLPSRAGEWQQADNQRSASELLAPQAWCDRYGLDVRDPDGWRGKDAPTWETPITLPDFWQRFNRSTVRDLHLVDYDRIVADVKAAKNDRSEK